MKKSFFIVLIFLCSVTISSCAVRSLFGYNLNTVMKPYKEGPVEDVLSKMPPPKTISKQGTITKYVWRIRETRKHFDMAYYDFEEKRPIGEYVTGEFVVCFFEVTAINDIVKASRYGSGGDCDEYIERLKQ